MANLSQQKRERMLAFLNKIKEEHKDDDETLIALDEIENELNSKKYGLVWEKHEEEVDRMMQDNIPVFTEVKEREIKAKDENSYNFLLEGDNLHSLRLLEKTHAGKIDVIYIDPPYNTGNQDFIYDDTFIDKTDGYAHSKWLSFMSERLEIAKKLLSDDGVIFISIDDREQAQLKLLCDSIFGEDNFIGNICRATGTTTGQDANKIGSSLDFAFVYRKTSSFILRGLPLSEKDMKRFNSIDGKGRYSTLQLRKTGNEDKREDRPNMFYPVIAPDGEKVYPFGPNGYLSRWRVSYDSYMQLKNDGLIIWKESNKTEGIEVDGIKKSKWTPYVKYYAEGRTKQVSNLWVDIDGNKKASIDLKKILEAKKFDYPKPVQLLKLFMLISSDKSATILDFFAGSGTTAQAVLELNKEDGGNRKFILCTNNENNICEEVTYERIRRVINGYADVEGIPANLKYFKTDFIPKDADDVNKELLSHIKEMVELENGITLDNKHYLIVLSDEQADELAKNWSNYEDVKAIYVSRNVLFTSEQDTLFSNTEIHIVPDYYFEYELKEVGETW